MVWWDSKQSRTMLLGSVDPTWHPIHVNRGAVGLRRKVEHNVVWRVWVKERSIGAWGSSGEVVAASSWPEWLGQRWRKERKKKLQERWREKVKRKERRKRKEKKRKRERGKRKKEKNVYRFCSWFFETRFESFSVMPKEISISCIN